VAEGARLESVYTARYPGFESLSLRHTFKTPDCSGKISKFVFLLPNLLPNRENLKMHRY
jgi:hypothetical protein